MMSQQDVQVIKALLAAFNDRDIEAALLYAHPEIEIRPSLVGGLEQKVYRGTEGFRQFGADIEAAWEEFSIEPVDFRSTPDGVLVLGNARARGRESGIRLSAPAA